MNDVARSRWKSDASDGAAVQLIRQRLVSSSGQHGKVVMSSVFRVADVLQRGKQSQACVSQRPAG